MMKQYPFKLDEPLLWFDRHPWTIRDSLEGVAILGDMGSGKTSGSGRTIRKAFMKAGYGGLVMTKRPTRPIPGLRTPMPAAGRTRF
jgi:hypothetical protein